MTKQGPALRVDLGANWKPYTIDLDGFHLLGTVRIGAQDVGALAQAYSNGRYYMINAAHLRELDERLIKPLIDVAAPAARRRVYKVI
jgi:hypothetical protein